jgi:hypothetical protein
LRALTAHHAYNLIVPRQRNPWTVHNFPISAFSMMVNDVAAGRPNDLAQSILNPAVILRQTEGPRVSPFNQYEGIILASLAKDKYTNGSEWLQAAPVEVDMANSIVLYLQARLLQP